MSPINPLNPAAGELIAAGVADERAGVKYSVARLDGWLTDPVRLEELETVPWLRARPSFDVLRGLRPSDWSESVHDLIRRARGK